MEPTQSTSAANRLRVITALHLVQMAHPAVEIGDTCAGAPAVPVDRLFTSLTAGFTG